jgi:hypothetical protein
MQEGALMGSNANAVIRLTGLPLAGGYIVDGTLGGRVAQVAAGLVLAVLLGLPGLLISLDNHLHHRS